MEDADSRRVASFERALWLRLRDRMRLFETTTTDFTDDQVAHVRQRGQIYLDVSRKLTLDDFARDLRKLIPASECLSCAVRRACAGGYSMLQHDVFEPEDAAVRSLLGGLSGAILDVGAGEAPYADALAPALRRGDGRYFVLEPDAAALRVLQSRLPEAEVLSSLDELPGPLNHALLLRSYNHLDRPGELIERVVQALLPGGTLLIVDNEAFGVVRDSRTARAAEHGPGKLEHTQNATADEVREVLAGFPLTLVAHRDVTAERSNQWWLHYRKAAP